MPNSRGCSTALQEAIFVDALDFDGKSVRFRNLSFAGQTLQISLSDIMSRCLSRLTLVGCTAPLQVRKG